MQGGYTNATHIVINETFNNHTITLIVMLVKKIQCIKG
jgi:hypothetical protein